MKVIKKNKQTEYIVQPEGSLGLLALGAVGLKAWRKLRFELNRQQKCKEEEKQNK